MNKDATNSKILSVASIIKYQGVARNYNFLNDDFYVICSTSGASGFMKISDYSSSSPTSEFQGEPQFSFYSFKIFTLSVIFLFNKKSNLNQYYKNSEF